MLIVLLVIYTMISIIVGINICTPHLERIVDDLPMSYGLPVFIFGMILMIVSSPFLIPVIWIKSLIRDFPEVKKVLKGKLLDD